MLTGANLDMAGFEAAASLKGVEADSVVIDSSTQATVTFRFGVPIAEEIPVISFI